MNTLMSCFIGQGIKLKCVLKDKGKATEGWAGARQENSSVFWLVNNIFIIIIFLLLLYGLQSELPQQTKTFEKLYQMGVGGLEEGRPSSVGAWLMTQVMCHTHSIKGNFYILPTQTHIHTYTSTVHTLDSEGGLFTSERAEKMKCKFLILL